MLSIMRSKRARAVLILIGAVVFEAASLWRASHRLAGNVIVRCRQGHLFTTIWIPGGSLKALRLGRRRFQHCPVGHHWSVVTPVAEAELSDGQLRDAQAHRDIRIP